MLHPFFEIMYLKTNILKNTFHLTMKKYSYNSKIPIATFVDGLYRKNELPEVTVSKAPGYLQQSLTVL